MKGEEAEKQWIKEELAEAIKKAVIARAPEFKAQASSLTFEGARRAIEQDLCMKRLSLDAHKKFIKRCLEECLSGDGGEKAPEPPGSSKTKAEKSTTDEPEETRNTSELENTGGSSFDETQASGTEIINEGNGVSKDTIKEALKERASFFKQHQETITFMKVRRLLEEDLNLPVKTLDVHKAFIKEELDKVMASLENDKSENGVQKMPNKVSKKVEKAQKPVGLKRTREESDSSDNAIKEEEHSEEDKPKRRKQAVSKVKAQAKAKASTKNSAIQKNSVEEKKKSTVSKSKKVPKKDREDNSDEEEGGNSSDKNVPGSSDEEEGAEKKKEKPAQVYGKKVEHLKSIIKSCGASIPPAVYRRTKQAPEDRREALLIKELEEILEKEGLSANPSEKEIKEVKRRKERAKELEGIDTSNIITSSRRRSSAFSYIPPPKPPKMESSSDDDDEDDDDSDDDDDVDLEKGHLNGDDDDGDGDGEHGGDEGKDNDGNEGKESDQDGGDDNN